MWWNGSARRCRPGSTTRWAGSQPSALGSHLEASITLGVRCTYRPAEPVGRRLGR
jgi:hypothetical protein